MSRTAAAVIALVLTVLVVGLYGAGWRLQAPQGAQESQHDSLLATVVDVMSVEDPLVRAARLATALQGFGPEALSEIEEAWIEVVGDFESPATVELALLVEWWCRHDPEGAFGWLHGRNRLRDPTLMTSLMRTWATRDPVAASLMFETFPRRPNEDLSRLLNALVLGWSASGEPGIERWLIAYPKDVERQIALSGLVADKVRRLGIEETVRWVEALPDTIPSKFKMRAFRRVATAISEVDPVRAAAWAENHLEEEWGSGLPRRVAMQWSPLDGPAAMKWLRGLPASPDVAKAVGDAYRAWLRKDGEAAGSWLLAQEVDASLEPAMAVYAVDTARHDPEAALSWAARVQDDARHEETLERIAGIWLRRDPAAARSWIETSDLSDVAKTRVYAANERAKNRSRKKAPAPDQGSL